MVRRVTKNSLVRRGFKRGYFPTLFLQGQSTLLLCMCQAYMHYENLFTIHKRCSIGDQFGNGVCVTEKQCLTVRLDTDLHVLWLTTVHSRLFSLTKYWGNDVLLKVFHIFGKLRILAYQIIKYEEVIFTKYGDKRPGTRGL